MGTYLSDLLEKAKDVQIALDFNTWTTQEIIDIFNIYVKRFNENPGEPNLKIISLVMFWAHKTNPQLLEKFKIVLKNNNIDLVKEQFQYLINPVPEEFMFND